MSPNRAAWITQAGANPLQVKDAPYNKPGRNEIVLAARAVAINPVDWKQQDVGMFIDEYPTIFGCDVAGIVEEVGEGVENLHPGDRVIANAVCLIKGPKYAAFQLFVVCPSNVTCHLPPSVSMEQGVVLPLAFNTAAIALYPSDALALPLSSLSPEASNKTVFIYGGSTSVGSTAIQLAKASGVRVVTAASRKNFEHCFALGADKVIDYQEGDWISKVADEVKRSNLAGAYDCVAHGSTTASCAEVLSKAGSSAPLMSTNPGAGADAKAVFGANMTLDDKLSSQLWAYLEKSLEAGKFQMQPAPKVVGSGLEAIQTAMDMHKKGAGAVKLVVTLP